MPIKEKPIKMFVYQPVYLSAKVVEEVAKENIAPEQGTEQVNPPEGKPETKTETKRFRNKYIKSKHIKFPFCRIEIGDVFTAEKRPKHYHDMMKHAESKVVAVRYNMAEGACIVILEKKVLESMDAINRFVNG